MVGLLSGTVIGLSAVDLGTITVHNTFRSGLHAPDTPSQTSQTKRHQKWCHGLRAGLRAKITQLGPKATPLQSVFMTNARSQENKWMK